MAEQDTPGVSEDVVAAGEVHNEQRPRAYDSSRFPHLLAGSGGEEGKKVVGSPKAVEVTDNGRMSVRTTCHTQKRRGVFASSATSSVSRFRRQVPSIRYTCKG